MSKIINVSSSGVIKILDHPTTGDALRDNLKTLQDMVGGYIEFIDLPENKAVMILNEEGKLYNLPRNIFATAMFRANYPQSQDYIVGDVAFLSEETNESGDPIGLSTEHLDALVSQMIWLTDEIKSEQIDRRETDRQYYAESRGE